MSADAIASLGKLYARTALLHRAHQYDAALEVAGRAAGELGALDEQDIRLAFATMLGFYSAAVLFVGSDDVRNTLATLQAVSEARDTEAMRSAFSAVINDMQAAV